MEEDETGASAADEFSEVEQMVWQDLMAGVSAVSVEADSWATE